MLGAAITPAPVNNEVVNSRLFMDVLPLARLFDGLPFPKRKFAPKVRAHRGPRGGETSVGLVSTVHVNASRRDIFKPADTGWIRLWHTSHRATFDGHPLHVAALRIIVVHRVVLGRAVVPHRDGVRRPVMTELIFRHEGLAE